MTRQQNGARRSVLAKAPVTARRTGYLTGFFKKTFAIAAMELTKLRHDPTELFTRAIQPTLWLLLFGQVFSHARAIPTGSLRYIDFLAPGILAQSVLFIAIFNGISIIWERDQGIVYKFLASPTPRSALVLGKAVSAGVRGLSQTVIIYLLGLLLGISFNWHPLALMGVMTFVFLGAALFSTFSLIVACWVKTRERFMGVGQVLTMPLFFASNAIYPVAMMPHWLQRISHLNPLTYQVDGLRSLMLTGSIAGSLGLWLDLAVLLAALTGLVMISAWLYPNIAR
ncbi:MAG: ABC transporter permease [Desulfobacteraceae bacterium]|nr:ABC transporter permease [Desulfobacteraceae bacterium]